ncbi:MAG TPA: lysine exporter LysO family protein [Candidatus Sulfomarinibacteraceae bacterium]|nr:lysine exporter LysO family protein [Candidatus Sulfomarinibacteraceae bacterium]
MKSSLLVLACFGSGVAAGSAGLHLGLLQSPGTTHLVLLLLLLLVGLGLGADAQAWHFLRSMHLKVALVPLIVIVGSLLGAALFSLVLPTLSLRDSLAVGAGFGYYSLSSVIITELRGQHLGVVALLANILREVMTLLFTPLLVRYFGRLAPIASGGATAMDTTLPLISRFAGPEYTAVAVLSGSVLTILVPLLVTLVLM